jgi:hypothetical protein
MGAGQVGLTEICAEQVGIFQTGVVQVSFAQIGGRVDVRLRGVCTKRLYFIVLESSTQVFWTGR